MWIRFIGILILFSLYCESATAQEQDGVNVSRSPHACQCFDFDCGCCENVHWTEHFNETICVNATYLKHDYGMSVTLTVNDFAVINETVSARNPPPICVVTPLTDELPVNVCLKIYDIDFEIKRACFMVIAKISVMKVPVLHLGCVHFPTETWHMENWWQRIRPWKTILNNSVDRPFVTQT